MTKRYLVDERNALRYRAKAHRARKPKKGKRVMRTYMCVWAK